MKKIFGILIFTFVLSVVFATTIYDIQYTDVPGPDGWYPSPLVDDEVTVTGIVTGANFGHGVMEVDTYIYDEDSQIRLIEYATEKYQYAMR